jgi:hypothetical protein
MRVASRQSPVASETRGFVPPPVGGRLGGGRSGHAACYDSLALKAITDSYPSPARVLGMAPPQPSPYGGGGDSPRLGLMNSNLLVTGDWRLATAR